MVQREKSLSHTRNCPSWIQSLKVRCTVICKHSTLDQSAAKVSFYRCLIPMSPNEYGNFSCEQLSIYIKRHLPVTQDSLPDQYDNNIALRKTYNNNILNYTCQPVLKGNGDRREAAKLCVSQQSRQAGKSEGGVSKILKKILS